MHIQMQLLVPTNKGKLVREFLMLKFASIYVTVE